MSPHHCRHHITASFSWTVQAPSQRQITLVSPLPSVEDSSRPSWGNLFLGWLLTDLIMPDLFVPTCTSGNAVLQCDFFLSLVLNSLLYQRKQLYSSPFLASFTGQAFPIAYKTGNSFPWVIFLCTCSSFRVHYPCVQWRGNTSLEGQQLQPLHI